MKRYIKALIMILLIVIYTASNTNFEIRADALDKASDSKVKEYIYLGLYPQSQVDEDELTYEIINTEYDENNDAVINGNRYKRVHGEKYVYEGEETNGGFRWNYGGDSEGYHYFKYEPVKWIVLKKSNGKLYLVTDKIIDVFECELNENDKESSKDIIFKAENWLNTYLVDSIFNIDEIKLLNEEKNKKMWLLTKENILDKNYGFSEYNFPSECECRKKVISEYAFSKQSSSMTHEMTSSWVVNSTKNTYLDIYDSGEFREYDYIDGRYKGGICPVICIDESDVEILKEEVTIYENPNYEYVWFGSYANKQLIKEEITSKIKNAKYSSNDEVIIEGIKYKRVIKNGKTYYFKYEPVKWRILSENNGNYLLFSEDILDRYIYDVEGKTSYSYEKSEIRIWLNDNKNGFIGNCFNSVEVSSLIENEELYNDKVWLIGYYDLKNSEYGFDESDKINSEKNRVGLVNDYSNIMDVRNSSFCGEYWLRDVDLDAGACGEVKTISYGGTIGKISDEPNVRYSNGTMIYDNEIGVRPVIMVSSKDELVFNSYEDAYEYMKNNSEVKDNSRKGDDSDGKISDKDRKDKKDNKKLEIKIQTSGMNTILIMLSIFFILGIIIYIYIKITKKSYLILSFINLKILIKNEKAFLSLIVISQICSVLIMLFVFGQLQKAVITKSTPDIVDMLIVGDFRDEAMPINEFKTKMYACKKFISEDFEMCSAFITDREEKLVAEIVNEDYYEEQYLGMFSYEQIIGSEKLARISKKSSVNEGETIVLNGSEYVVIGKYNSDMINVPIETIEEEAVVNSFQVNLYSTPTKDRAEEIAAFMIKAFGDKLNISMPEGIDLMRVRKNNVIIICSVLLSVLIAINTAICFGFIFNKRRKIYSVLEFCGSGRKESFIISFGEMFIIIAGCMFISLTLFVLFIVNNMIKRNAVFDIIYSEETYMLILGLYVMITLITLFMVAIKSIRKSLINRWREL